MLVQGRKRVDLLAEDVFLDVMRESFDLVRCVLPRRYTKHVVEFFE